MFTWTPHTANYFDRSARQSYLLLSFKICEKIDETQLKHYKKRFHKIMKLLMKFLKNLHALYGKILFAKFWSKILKSFESEICLKKFKANFEDILERYKGRFYKSLTMVFLKFCDKFPKIWRCLKKYLEDSLEKNTE